MIATVMNSAFRWIDSAKGSRRKPETAKITPIAIFATGLKLFRIMP